jgi:hypothetical protein
MVASPRHADAGRSVTAAPEQLPRAAAAPRGRDEAGAGSRRSEEVARKRAAPASGRVAAAEEVVQGRRQRLWRSVEAAALYIVAVLRRSASDKGLELPLPAERKAALEGKGSANSAREGPRAGVRWEDRWAFSRAASRRFVSACQCPGGAGALAQHLASHHVMVMVTELSMEADRQSSSDRVQAQ